MRRIVLTLVAIALAGAAAFARGNERRWQDLTPAEREQAWRNYREYQQLPEERRRFLDRRYDRYRDLPPSERRRLRKNWDRYRELGPRDRQRFNERYRQWKSKSKSRGGGSRDGGTKGAPKKQRR